MQCYFFFTMAFSSQPLFGRRVRKWLFDALTPEPGETFKGADLTV
jgi:hypothetical protein